MKKFIVVLSLAVFIAPFSAPSFAQGQDGEAAFSSVIQDLPLMPGLVEVEEQAVVFDKPEGRIIESVAVTGPLARADIAAYYAQALPQLGWTGAGADTYIRQNERLILSFENHGGQDFIRFMVKPKDG